jgi:hypothetical protein
MSQEYKALFHFVLEQKKSEGMTRIRDLIPAVLFLAVGVLAAPAISIAAPAPPPILQKTFNATIDQVYAAEAQSVGSTLKSTVKEGCLVNFEVTEDFGSGFGGRLYRVIRWTATCKDAGNGKTTVTLSWQMKSTTLGSDGRALKQQADVFWSNMDGALKNASPAPAQIVPQAAPDAEVLTQVSSDPSGADIALDGDYVGSTPSQIKLKPGTHFVKITKKGFQPWERSIKVEAGESRSIAAELEKAN